MRSATSASDLAVEGLLARQRKFFATCWVMVEAPCGRRLAPRLEIGDTAARAIPSGSTPLHACRSSCPRPRGRPRRRASAPPGSAGRGAARGNSASRLPSPACMRVITAGEHEADQSQDVAHCSRIAISSVRGCNARTLEQGRGSRPWGGVPLWSKHDRGRHALRAGPYMLLLVPDVTAAQRPVARSAGQRSARRPRISRPSRGRASRRW
jgi:hypothetical protein